MSRFAPFAALVKGVVLKQFGEQMDLFAATKTEFIKSTYGVFLNRVQEADQFEITALNADVKIVKLDIAVASLIKINNWLRDKNGNWYRFDQPADVSTVARGAKTDSNFVYWYLK
ncbi:hypothetical protein [Arsukibacterium indicum]|uniref:Uncharacterized protein n=1 Tax=Arsukibacterium indicum TaxID=2848612 RepID=A0ABS6MGH6_9GAMM|nr:hypothetical protein [Arsukibacterium indicum]MBV2127925.1 hypothetical protein [Arsukibacterium indicum]